MYRMRHLLRKMAEGTAENRIPAGKRGNQEQENSME
jgi:hypothetical protein